MNLMNMPGLWYFIDWNAVNGTYTMGFIGLFVCLIACTVCWYQIKNDTV